MPRLFVPHAGDEVAVTARLPELLPTGSVLGPAAARGRRRARRGAGVPVVCGVPDLHAAVVGLGAVAPDESHIAISTTSWVGARAPFKLTDVSHQIPPFRASTRPIRLWPTARRTAGWRCTGRASSSTAPTTACWAVAAASPRRRRRRDTRSRVRRPPPSSPGAPRPAEGVLFMPGERRAEPGRRQGGPGRLAQPFAAQRPHMRCAGRPRASPTTRAGCSTPTRSSSSRPRRRCASSAAAKATLWCQIQPTCWPPGRAGGRPTPRAFAGRPGAPSASASSPSTRCRRSPRPRPRSPLRRHAAVYREGYAQYRKLYGRLKGLHHRLNSRKVTS